MMFACVMTHLGGGFCGGFKWKKAWKVPVNRLRRKNSEEFQSKAIACAVADDAGDP
jgi:hypothetical protein